MLLKFERTEEPFFCMDRLERSPLLSRISFISVDKRSLTYRCSRSTQQVDHHHVVVTNNSPSSSRSVFPSPFYRPFVVLWHGGREQCAVHLHRTFRICSCDPHSSDNPASIHGCSWPRIRCDHLGGALCLRLQRQMYPFHCLGFAR